MSSGIYCIRNIKNGKLYVGKDVRLPKRFRKHVKDLLDNSSPNKHMQEDWNIFGENSFIYEVLEICEKDDLETREIFYISEMKSRHPNGYNILSGGEGKGFKKNKKIRLKISKSLVGIKHSTERIANIITGRRNGKQLVGKKNPAFGKKKNNSSSKYFGVNIHKRKNRKDDVWDASVRVNGKLIFIKSSKSEIICAKAYNDYVIKNKLENPLNII